MRVRGSLTMMMGRVTVGGPGGGRGQVRAGPGSHGNHHSCLYHGRRTGHGMVEMEHPRHGHGEDHGRQEHHQPRATPRTQEARDTTTGLAGPPSPPDDRRPTMGEDRHHLDQPSRRRASQGHHTEERDGQRDGGACDQRCHQVHCVSCSCEGSCHQEEGPHPPVAHGGSHNVGHDEASQDGHRCQYGQDCKDQGHGWSNW